MARLGATLGASSWLVAFVILTVPDTFRFAPQIAGGAVMTVGIVVLIDQVLRHARRVPVALVGALCLGAIAVASYWAGVAEPALRASPATRARIERLQFRYGLGVPGGSGTRRRVSG
jgi:hypothetical protein